ncbi:helix-turn-helix domain-containing protein [Winslowiella iniecta]|uniref:Arabinose operon regulatory protein n=1 Tax=Winslowiella iniecta TaxID=1560201 RepID=A0A0L7SZE0_9GAMM|nr:helix-turn-helix domain-containing protein [Winslowiella iniecta]KOC88544.1 hypothetical protein NG42_15920 [Winslowiella iniecta]KOC90577.1 hypothetical protein NG43_17070 [Winslowiella iniecta]
MLKLCIDEYFSSSSNLFSLYVSDPECNDCEHCHEFDELVMVESGHGIHVINGKPSYIQQGDVFYVRRDQYHFYDRLGTLKLTNLLINSQQPFRYLNNLDQLMGDLNGVSQQQPGWLMPEQRIACKSLISQLTRTGAAQPELSDAAQEVKFFNLILSINKSLHTTSRSHTKYKAYRLIAWLQSNCFEQIDWDELSHRFLLTKRTLYRQIKETTGMTPEQFIRQLRLESARMLLRTGEENITGIAFKCGFSSSNHFSACYKSVFGYPPSQERRQN